MALDVVGPLGVAGIPVLGAVVGDDASMGVWVGDTGSAHFWMASLSTRFDSQKEPV